MRPTRSILRPLTLAAALLAFGGAAGCTGPSGQTPDSSGSPVVAAPSTAPPPSTSAGTSPGTSAGPSAGEQPAQSFGILEAITAAQKAEDGAVTDAELSRFGETSAWKVDVRRSRSVSVELVITNNGKVQSRSTDDTDDEARTVPDSAAADAIRAAQKRVEGQATSVELDSEGGQRVWEVKISRPGDQPVAVSYDADSGKFVRQIVDN